jgi:hypothetical protein
LKSVFTPGQAKAWKTESDARSAYRQRAITTLIVSAFDQKTGISEDQWAKLEPKVADLLKEYGDEFGRYYISSPPTEWYLQSVTMFVPMAGIPEKDMKSILTADQWTRWSGSEEFGNASNYWENIQQTHQRVRLAK